ncbi:TMEM175 family protein [Deinococcus arenicola]|uniref:TMEM175 family protein n=1 Tax=Deinococcus arenicola TaxID=2994950 RepID=A0ABU4DMU4_9DEIO|nr:TMEM175 family protein [Deinococcus sp. ZS9-10]MDV6373755.1 TMEM175 family protein [Deinococcus sp. ZS9-10]
MKKSRLEAFSDGVLAIIITIMVLELRTPEGHEWSDLWAEWPKLLAYVISFAYVGIYWNNHHHLLYTAKRIDGKVMWANLHLLFWLSVLPFLTGWAGESGFAATPMTAYALDLLLCALAYSVLQRTLIRANQGKSPLAEAMGRDAKGKISPVAYIVAATLPFLGASGIVLSGVIIIAVAVMWFIPDPRIERVMEASEGLGE